MARHTFTMGDNRCIFCDRGPHDDDLDHVYTSRDSVTAPGPESDRPETRASESGLNPFDGLCGVAAFSRPMNKRDFPLGGDFDPDEPYREYCDDGPRPV